MRIERFLITVVCVSTLIFFSALPSSHADLVGYWNFDDESADDQSGKGNDGIDNGVEFSDDVPNGDGMSLDTINGGTIQIPHSDSLGMEDTMSIAYWMRAENLDQPSDWNGPMGKISDPREAGGWEMQRFGDQSRIDIRIDTSDAPNSVRGNITGTFDDEWVHVVWTVDEGEVVSYLDGEFVQISNYPHGDGFGNESDLFFGNRANCCTYVGLLDEINIWDNVLAEDDIAKLAEGISPLDLIDTAIPGDFDNDSDLDADDVNALIASINGAMGAEFDVSGNGSVDGDDLNFWVKMLRMTWIGDANLDGEFNSSDFVSVFQTGKFETGQPASWGDGDWNGDGVFSSGDFVVAFQDGGFEQGPLQKAVQAVPEPNSLVFVMASIAAFWLRFRAK